MGIIKQDYQFTTALMEVKFGEPIISYVYFTQLKSWGTAFLIAYPVVLLINPLVSKLVNLVIKD